MLNNKRGDEIFSIWNIIILVLIGVILMVGVWVYLSSKTDIRSLEAEILSTKISKCLMNKGYLDINSLDNSRKLLDNCEINSEMIMNSGYFYINLTLLQNLEDKNITKNLDMGNRDLVMQCTLKEQAKAEKFGSCTEHLILVNYFDNKIKKEGILKIFVGVNNNDEKI